MYKITPSDGEMVSGDFPWSRVGLWEGGGAALAWIWKVPCLWANPSGGASRKLALGLCHSGREPVA